jgi:TetR/AcrR family transcriptional repressor of nem operon
MSDVAAAIMDAAERRMRKGGFSGFSFREIAADVGVKSSSVHYHFPTKENLAAAVIQRYTAQTADLIERELQKEPNPVKRSEGPCTQRIACVHAPSSVRQLWICRRKYQRK